MQASEKDYLDLAYRLAGSCYTLASAYHRNHASGFADWNGILPRTPYSDGKQALGLLETWIDDQVLWKALRQLESLVQEMVDLDRQIVLWLAEYAGLLQQEDESIRKHLDGRLHEIAAEGPSGPVWVLEPGYSVLAEKSKEVMSVVNDVYRRIEQRIERLLKTC
jgi:hypothetical protein